MTPAVAPTLAITPTPTPALALALALAEERSPGLLLYFTSIPTLLLLLLHFYSYLTPTSTTSTFVLLLQVFFVATAVGDATPLYTRSEPRRPWRTASDARALFAAFETLPSVGKARPHVDDLLTHLSYVLSLYHHMCQVIKRAELMFSATHRTLDCYTFAIERRYVAHLDELRKPPTPPTLGHDHGHGQVQVVRGGRAGILAEPAQMVRASPRLQEVPRLYS